ncbi:hypothetical protein [uncultured Campylobacter sp.]|uniref:hypothetical protein n=1 Tax=uncultured Campylobacter sp. TaxID=218934 RepID=UPI002639AADB|nr:hypothetical protein [uncultured Campylobacter sp.]
MDAQSLSARLNKPIKILLVLFGIGILANVAMEFYTEKKRGELERNFCESKQVRDALARINESAPRRIDDATILKGAACEEGSFIYDYALNSSPNLDLSALDAGDAEILKEMLLAKAKASFCSTEFSQRLRELGKTMVLNYEIEGLPPIQLNLDKNSCER